MADDKFDSIIVGAGPAGVSAAIMGTVNAFMNVGAAAMAHDIPLALGRKVRHELLWGRVSTVVLTVAAAIVARFSGTLVAFLGIFGWGLFASTLVPTLAIGLNWAGATRAGAIASISTGLATTLGFESAAYFKVFTVPTGVTVSGFSLVLSLMVFFLVSALTHRQAAEIDPDIKLVMDT